MSTTSSPDPPNATIAALFDELADLYELDGASIHRVLAYRTAGRSKMSWRIAGEAVVLVPQLRRRRFRRPRP